jgi:hypothetical protein
MNLRERFVSFCASLFEGFYFAGAQMIRNGNALRRLAFALEPSPF